MLKCCPKNEKIAQILFKSQGSAQECWKCKIVLQIRKSALRNHDMATQPVRLLRPNIAVLYHVNGNLQRAYQKHFPDLDSDTS